MQRTSFSGAQALALGALVVSLSVTRAAGAAEPSPYPACEREPTESEVSAAKGAYEAGQVSFHEADYARAILYWEDAFRRDCTAVKLLLNLARAYELSGKKHRAVLALETYIERNPEASDRGSIEKRIAKLRQQLEEEEAAAAAEQQQAAAEEPTLTEEPPEDESPSAAKKPAWPVILTGVGVVALGAGIPVWLTGQSDLDQVIADYEERDCFENSCPEDLVDDANQAASGPKAQRNAGIAMTVAGGALAVTGGVLWAVLWSKSDSQTAKSLVPVVAPGYAGLSLQGSF